MDSGARTNSLDWRKSVLGSDGRPGWATGLSDQDALMTLSDGHVDVHYMGGESMSTGSRDSGIMAEAPGPSGNASGILGNPSGVAAQNQRWRSKDSRSGVAAQSERRGGRGDLRMGRCDMSSSDHSSGRHDSAAMEAIAAVEAFAAQDPAHAGLHGMQHGEGGPMTELSSLGQAVQGINLPALLRLRRLTRHAINPLDDPLHPLASIAEVYAGQEGFMETDSLERLQTY
eukprot:gene31439-6617_t